jgi:hypothetical protein
MLSAIFVHQFVHKALGRLHEFLGGTNDSFVYEFGVQALHSSWHQYLTVEAETVSEKVDNSSTFTWLISLKRLHCDICFRQILVQWTVLQTS